MFLGFLSVCAGAPYLVVWSRLLSCTLLTPLPPPPPLRVWPAMATLRHDVPTLKDGWLLKEGRVLRSRTRRFLRLKGTILSNHHTPSSPASWEVSVISCPVTSGPREHELVLALPTRRLSFFAETTADYDAWVVALRTASARAVEDYYVMGEVLGAGSFAQVHRAVDRGTGEEVAVKVINKAGYDARELEYVVREVAIMRSLNHPNIVSTYDIFETSTHLYLVIELCAGGELFDIVADHGHLSEQRASQVMRSIVRGLEYLHSEGICHRDIKVRLRVRCKRDPWREGGRLCQVLWECSRMLCKGLQVWEPDLGCYAHSYRRAVAFAAHPVMWCTKLCVGSPLVDTPLLEHLSLTHRVSCCPCHRAVARLFVRVCRLRVS